MVVPFVNFSVPGDRTQAVLPCSIAMGCTIVLPSRERLQNVTIGDERYTVRIADDGSNLPAHLLIYPSRGNDALQTRIDITSTARAYAVILQPTQQERSYTLTFTAPQLFTLPTPLGESAPLDPAKMIFGAWHYRGDPALACASLFEHAASVWCRLPKQLTKAPSVYGIVGNVREPVDARVVDRTYLVIHSVDGPFELDLLSNGTEHHGILEHV
jgi:hypothetical protein